MTNNNAQQTLMLSVIVPCHNSRRDYLERVLTALRAQTLPQQQWELVVVDNVSNPPLSNWVDVSWHVKGRVVSESKLGLTSARLRGFSETSGAIIVMVDDDNVLAPDYLENVVRIAAELPVLGAFGGSIDPIFDVPPPAWTIPYWSHIAIRPVRHSLWSNDIDHWLSTPSGAGMCVRRNVANQYASQLQLDPIRSALGRTGNSLVSGEDTDLAWTACAMGLGMGCFQELKVNHLIPPERLTEPYLLRMFEGKGYSGAVLNSLWNRTDPAAIWSGTFNLLKMGIRRLLEDRRDRRFLAAKKRGEAKARVQLSTLHQKEKG